MSFFEKYIFMTFPNLIEFFVWLLFNWCPCIYLNINTYRMYGLQLFSPSSYLVSEHLFPLSCRSSSYLTLKSALYLSWQAWKSMCSRFLFEEIYLRTAAAVWQDYFHNLLQFTKCLLVIRQNTKVDVLIFIAISILIICRYGFVLVWKLNSPDI